MADASKYTGGQYSLLRVALGYLTAFAMFLLVAATEGSWIVTALGIVAGILICVGAYDRVVAILSGVAVIALSGQLPGDLSYGPVILCVLLLLHALVPPGPYGSWASRNRTDPGGGWKMPARNRRMTWLVLSVAYAYLGALELGDSVVDWPIAIALIAFGPLALVGRIRPFVWTLFLVGILFAFLPVLSDHPTGLVDWGAWLLFHLFAFEPAWIRPTKREERTVVFFDGTCGLCHRTARMLIAEDAYDNLRFAPLQGSTFEEARGERPAKSFPDSLIVFAPNGDVLSKSTAVLEALSRLGGFWRLKAAFLRNLTPRVVRDMQYDQVAQARRMFFAKPKDLCPLMPPELADRFLP